MTSARCIVAALLVAFAPALANTAHAEPSAGDLASARALFKEGRALREKGDLPKALEKLRAAHALGQTPITGLELARTYVLVGRLVDAHEVSIGVARLPVASDETSKSDAARAAAAKLATALEPRLAKITVSVKGLPPGSTAVVLVDGETVPPAAVGEPRSADPGAHVAILKESNGVEVRAGVEVKEGESREVVLDATPVPEPPAASVVVPVTPVPPNEQPLPASHYRSPLLLVTAATTAGFGLLFGASFGVATLNAKNSLAIDCPGGRCGPQHYDELSTAQTDATVSTVSFIVAGVGAGALIFDLILRSNGSKEQGGAHARLEPELGVGWAGVHGAF